MCGIAGFWLRKETGHEPTELLRCMGNTLAHRGPDDSGIFFDKNADAMKSTGEPGLPGVTVYLDSDGSGALDVELSQTTDAGGHYAFEEGWLGREDLVHVIEEAEELVQRVAPLLGDQL